MNKDNERVPEGDYFWKPEDKRMSKVVIIFDQGGQLFLVDLISRHVFWVHKTKTPSYSLLLTSKEIDDYMDIRPFDDDDEMMLYHHHANRAPQLISFSSKDDLLQKLKQLYQVNPAGLKVDVKKHEFDLDYQSGTVATPQTAHEKKFSIERQEFEISFYSREPATLRWQLNFSILEPKFPISKCPCKVLHARTPDEFVALCSKLGITDLPGGGLVSDLQWLNSYRSSKIVITSNHWIKHKTEGLYEGKSVHVMRMEKNCYSLGKIRYLRLLEDGARFGMIGFHGWKEAEDYFYLAIDTSTCDIEEFVSHNKDRKVSLDILKEIAIAVYKMREGVKFHVHPNNVFIMDNGKPKLGLPLDQQVCSQSNDDEDLRCLAYLMLYIATRGSYTFGDNVDAEQLDKYCLNPELRDLIHWLLSERPPTLNELLRHPWLWDTQRVISFICTFSDFINGNSYAAQQVDNGFSKHNVFVAPWDNRENGLADNFVKERSNAIAEMNGLPYNTNQGSSLVRIMRNGFTHCGQMEDDVKETVGATKEDMWNKYFHIKFPKHVSVLHRIGKEFSNKSDLRSFYKESRLCC